MFGLYNLNKPQDWTSRDCVNKIAKRLGIRRCGHAGTLDPLATGVLVIAVGGATRLVPYIQQQNKRYIGRFRLGWTSPSADDRTEMTACPPEGTVTLEQLRSAAATQVGDIEQIPPVFSAKKIGGRRAYELARASEEVEMLPCRVRIDSCEVTQFDGDAFELSILCGSGTYVRSIGRDIAAQLGTSAVMTDLVRTAVGPFTIAAATTVEAICDDPAGCLLPTAMAVEHLPQRELPPELLTRLRHGQIIDLHAIASDAAEVAITSDSHVHSLVRKLSNGWKAEKNFDPMTTSNG